MLLSLRHGSTVEQWVVLGQAQPLGRAEIHARGGCWPDGLRLVRPSRLTSEAEDIVWEGLEEGGARE